MTLTRLHLFKQNFKFSAAHFLIFDAHSAEKLHGHNYQVRVDLEGPPQEEDLGPGYLIDFKVLKKVIKDRLDQWDERVLLPARHPEMKISEEKAASGEAPSLQVLFRDRRYVFPLDEVCLLEINNTSTEQLSRILAEDFAQEFRAYGIRRVEVLVEETPGQGASTEIRTGSA